MARAGRLRSLITIQSKTQSSTTDLNEPIYTWATWKQVWAGLEWRRGGEMFTEEGKQRYSQVTFRFRFRFYDVDGINAEMRILFEGQVYDIKSILPNFDRRNDVFVDAWIQDGEA